MKARTVLAACMILCGLVVALVVPAVVRADNGHQDGAYTAGTSGAPTTSKPESKVWFSHKKWWAVMARKVATGGNTYFIFRLNARKQRWVNTHVAVDTRDSTRQDVLSVGSKLFIASHKYVDVAQNAPTPDPKDEMRLFLFRYRSGAHRYVPAGTPYQVIDGQKSETLVIDRDSTGAIWATWVQATGGGQHQVYVRKTNGNCVAAFANCAFTVGPTVTLGDVSDDDISSVVRFGGNKVGVMWSDTRDVNDDKILFAVHQDGDSVVTWTQDTSPAVGGRKMADDHVNLKADSKGRIFAVTKTKFSGATKPGTMLLRRTAAGTWKHFTVSRGSLDHTRPIVLLDERHNRIRVFEGSAHNNAVFMKNSRLSRPSFPVLKAGARVIRDNGSEMGNPTSTKQRVGRSHFVVLATNPETKRYWHAWVRTRP
jgi:hypothetical protein